MISEPRAPYTSTKLVVVDAGSSIGTLTIANTLELNVTSLFELDARRLEQLGPCRRRHVAHLRRELAVKPLSDRTLPTLGAAESRVRDLLAQTPAQMPDLWQSCVKLRNSEGLAEPDQQEWSG